MIRNLYCTVATQLTIKCISVAGAGVYGQVNMAFPIEVLGWLIQLENILKSDSGRFTVKAHDLFVLTIDAGKLCSSFPTIPKLNFEIPIRFNVVNDIQVDGRKIGGTGAATVGESMIVAGSLMFDFNYELMVRVLRVPSEKFRDKMYSTMKEYLTTINRQLGDDAPSREEGIRILIECFNETLGTELVMDGPRPDELAAIAEHLDAAHAG